MIGVILYEGPSRIDGNPIVAIATFGTRNEKTGPMVQTWILRADVHPVEARKVGADASICGGCKFRPAMRSDKNAPQCYVAVHFGPSAVYKAYKAGKYRRDVPLARVGLGQFVRLGSYGDPAAVPVEIWREVLADSIGHTGYTHQWRSERIAGEFRTLCQASCDNPKDVADATAKGWGTYHVLPQGADVPENGVNCPASKEAGNVATCASCRMCDGKSLRHVFIRDHSGITVSAAKRRKSLPLLTA